MGVKKINGDLDITGAYKQNGAAIGGGGTKLYKHRVSFSTASGNGLIVFFSDVATPCEVYTYTYAGTMTGYAIKINSTNIIGCNTIDSYYKVGSASSEYGIYLLNHQEGSNGSIYSINGSFITPEGSTHFYAVSFNNSALTVSDTVTEL